LQSAQETLLIPFGAKQLSAVLCRPTVPLQDGADVGVILSHGAGGDMNFRQLVSLAHTLAAKGFLCLQFWPSTGRSMGSRVAVALLRQLSDGTEDAARGLICLSFPLHTASQRDTYHQRSQDLRQLPQQTTVLFVSGTQDDMCDRDLLNKTVEDMKAQVDVLWLNGGSHGLAVKGRSEDSVMEEVNSYVTMWISKQVTR
uniref:KANL3/Tex30 alpha/beta hydrolase-like domain-containing protein n=1 Tax=Periophthalmus magnuspinnatus TaxID=409849 RepID=A0A3B4AWK1_9GOBI